MERKDIADWVRTGSKSDVEEIASIGCLSLHVNTYIIRFPDGEVLAVNNQSTML